MYVPKYVYDFFPFLNTVSLHIHLHLHSIYSKKENKLFYLKNYVSVVVYTL